MRSKWITSLATIMLGMVVGCANQNSPTPEPAPTASSQKPVVRQRPTTMASGGWVALNEQNGRGNPEASRWKVVDGGTVRMEGTVTMTIRVNTAEPTEKVTYLGVSTSPVSPALRAQLNLDKSMGLMVDSVEKGSPAEAAGIKQYDVIQLLGDQMIVDEHQMSVLVRNHKAGDQIKLTVIHQGKPTVLTAKLVEKEVAVAPRLGREQGKERGMEREGRGMMGPGHGMMGQGGMGHGMMERGHEMWGHGKMGHAMKGHSQGMKGRGHGMMGRGKWNRGERGEGRGEMNNRGEGPMHSFFQRFFGGPGFGSEHGQMLPGRPQGFGNPPPQNDPRQNKDYKGPWRGGLPQGMQRPGGPRGNPLNPGPQPSNRGPAGGPRSGPQSDNPRPAGKQPPSTQPAEPQLIEPLPGYRPIPIHPNGTTPLP